MIIQNAWATGLHEKAVLSFFVGLANWFDGTEPLKGHMLCKKKENRICNSNKRIRIRIRLNELPIRTNEFQFE